MSISEGHYANALPQGHLLEGYRIGSVLGAGGFGITYLAEEEPLGRRVALKEFLPREIAGRHANRITVRPHDAGVAAEQFRFGLDRFRDEARTLLAFEHPNVVQILRYLEANNTAYYVMPFVEGRALDQLLSAVRSLTGDELRPILFPLLDALDAVHKAAFLHRDIKPANIFVRSDGRPVLIDFGAARMAIGEHSRTLTAVLSPGYAPFEQYHEHGNQGPWTDLYALGATIYRCLTGKAPPEATVRVNAAMQRRTDPMVSALEAGAGCADENFLAATDCALAIAETDRPQSVEEFRALLAGGEKAVTTMSPMTLVAGPILRKTSSKRLGFSKIELRPIQPGRVFQEEENAPEMVIIPSGEFMMGSDQDAGNEQPRHRVTITRPFALSRFAVTFEQWDYCVAMGGSTHQPDDNGWGRGKQPVVNVSWTHANEFAAWLSSMTGAKYRLPTEAEWEFAARARSTSNYWWGDDIGKGNANCYSCGSKWDKTQPALVGSFPPNSFGLHEILGNVMTWIGDDWIGTYRGAPMDGTAYKAERFCGLKPVRGGSYASLPWSLRCSNRQGYFMDFHSTLIGFRIARSID